MEWYGSVYETKYIDIHGLSEFVTAKEAALDTGDDHLCLS